MNFPKIDIQIHDCKTIEVEDCTQAGRTWKELTFFDKEGRAVAEIAVWGPEADASPLVVRK